MKKVETKIIFRHHFERIHQHFSNYSILEAMTKLRFSWNDNRLEMLSIDK